VLDPAAWPDEDRWVDSIRRQLAPPPA